LSVAKSRLAFLLRYNSLPGPAQKSTFFGENNPSPFSAHGVNKKRLDTLFVPFSAKSHPQAGGVIGHDAGR